ncbi:elongation of very long chain fatty acids protein AAEL008004 isoform X4 [Cephus cinctus]|uniref:Elongation of very long chain fatty acids protein n=1 Tax=Cephus cinctus TaxID=211228 RepID=A0AAJ7FTU2_CEPCN|nr:elongation of very long chain fatty acids protein AAEL008004 isoform X4 [Cephus cinctus]
MSIIMQYVDRFHEMLDKHADSRTTNWFLMSSPFPTLFICLGYVYLVKVLGPKIMENRKPFQLKNVLIAYNLFQVIFSAWLFYEMVYASWWYYFSKFTEFMDTIFFVLRKKNDHVSTLHVIHHGCMPMSVWFGVKFTPGGHSTFFGLLNTFVHIVMYSYYLLAAFGPKMQPYLWWKKYLTAFQMLQFIAIMIHAFQLLFIDCNYPKAFVWWIGMHAVMFFFLFNEFYQQSYAQKNLRRAKAAAAKALANGSAGTGLSNGVANGTTASSKSAVNSSSGNETNLTNGSTSRRRDPADYYIKGESLAASELNLRKPFVSSE